MKRWSVFISLVSLLIIVCFLGCKKSNGWRLVSDSRFYTKEQLTDLYFENQELFAEVANAVLTSDNLKAYIFDSHDGDFGIYTFRDKRFFSDDEWEKILVFSNKVKYYMIMRDIEFDAEGVVHSDKVHFDFPAQRIGDNYRKYVSLYYFSSQEIAETYIEDSVRSSEYSKVEPNWWIREETYN